MNNKLLITVRFTGPEFFIFLSQVVFKKSFWKKNSTICKYFVSVFKPKPSHVYNHRKINK